MKYKLFLLTMLLLLNLQFAALPVSACTPGRIEHTQQEYIAKTGVVVVGIVTGTSSSDPYTAQYTIQIESYLKAAGPDTLLITGYGTGGGDCRNAIAIGERWIFFLKGDPKADDIMKASYYSIYDAVHEASDENIALTSILTGQSPTAPYATPIWTLIKYWTYSPVFKVATLVGIPAVVILGGLAIGMRAKRGSAKKKNS